MTRDDDDGSEGGYEKLEVYQRAMSLMKTVHGVVKTFPDYERFDLVSQIRRASKSVPANIGEGYARRSQPKEFMRSLRIALGSANEMEIHLKTARELEYLDRATCNELIREYVIVGKQLRNLIKYWRSVDNP